MNDENKKEKVDNTIDRWYAAEAEARKNAQEAPKSTAEYTQEDAQKAEQLRAETPWKTETFTPEPSWQDKEAQARQTAVDRQAEIEAKAKAVADAAAKAKAEEDAIAEETAKAAQSHTTGKYDPTPGRWYADEAEGRAAELARSQGTWTGSEATNDSDDPYAMYGGGIEPVVFVAEGKKEEEPKEETKEEGVKRETKKIEKLDPIKDPSLGALNIKPKEEETKKEETKEEPKEEDEITKWGKKISELEEHKKKLLEQDETAKRRGRSMKMIAGISDGLASLANLIGVGSYGSSHINTGDALTPLDKKLEAARLERKADIKSIDDRLDQYRNQVSRLRQQREDQAYQSAEAEKGRQFQATEAQKGRTFQAAEGEKERTWKSSESVKERGFKEKVEDIKDRRAREKQAQDLEFKKSENDKNRKSREGIAAADRASRERLAREKAQKETDKNTTEFILTDKDGRESKIGMPKKTSEAIMNDFENIISKDLKDPNNTALVEAYAKYQELVTKRGVLGGDTKEILDARKALISLSPSMQERIRKYGEVVSEDPATPTAPKAVKDPNSRDFVIKAPNGEDVTYTLSKEDAANFKDEMYDILREEYDSGNTTPEIDKAYDEYTKRLAEWSKNDSEETEQRVYDAFKDIVAVSPALQKKLMEYVEEDEFAANKVN